MAYNFIVNTFENMDNTLSTSYMPYGFQPFWVPPYHMGMPMPSAYQQQMIQLKQFHLQEAKMAAMEQENRIQGQLMAMKASNKK